jgi:metal-responsive CopG/Arc/MetJ family transcriptional regulator
MKSAISIPDDVFEDAERLARRLGHSRSQLYAKALRELVARYEPDHVTAALDASVANEPQGDAFMTEAGRRVLERTPW